MDFAGNVALKIGHFFRAFINQETVEPKGWIAFSESLAEIFQKSGFSCLGRRDNQSALSFADRAKDVHRPHRKFGGPLFQFNTDIWINGCFGKKSLFIGAFPRGRAAVWAAKA